MTELPTGPVAGPSHEPPGTTLRKHHIRVGEATVAYVDEGDGPPLLLLHGCPFSSFIWRKVIARLRDRRRCIAPDLLGLGDTEPRWAPTGRYRLRPA